MSGRSIAAIVTDCFNFTFPPLPKEVQSRIFSEVGSKDMNCWQNKTVLKYHPGIRIKVL